MNTKNCGINIFVVMAILLLGCNTLLADTTNNTGDFFYAHPLPKGEEVEGVVGTASINDAPFYYSKETELRDIKGKKTSISYFQEGMTVSFAYKVDGVNDILTFIQHVPKLNISEDEEDNAVSDTPTAPVPATKSEPIRQEGGVWKN